MEERTALDDLRTYLTEEGISEQEFFSRMPKALEMIVKAIDSGSTLEELRPILQDYISSIKRLESPSGPYGKWDHL